MPFHVEISSGLNHARAFNLDETELRRVVGRWVSNRNIELGDREWEPRKSSLKILEGPALDNPDLSFGQGWANAERSAKNVTRSVVAEAAEAVKKAAPAVMVVGAADSANQTVAEIASDPETSRIAWEQARAWIDDRDPEVAVVILVIERAEPEPRREPPRREA
jgi:hypothetical protein